ARRLRRERFDLAVSPHRSLRTALLLTAARIPRRVGFRESRGALLYHTRVPRDRRRHDVERNLALLEPFGAPLPAAPRLHLAVDPDAAARAAALLPTGPQPLVGIAPGSVWATNRWTPTGFAAVAAALDAEGARCVLLGSSADLACRPCARHGGQRCPRGTEDCMHLVEPAAVLAAARRALAARVRA